MNRLDRKKLDHSAHHSHPLSRAIEGAELPSYLSILSIFPLLSMRGHSSFFWGQIPTDAQGRTLYGFVPSETVTTRVSKIRS